MPMNYAGQPPYGFQWADGNLVKNEEEATVRLLAFELFVEHRRKGTVARILNERELRPRRSAKWRDVTVGRLLSCPSAIGQYAVNKTTTDSDGKRIEKPESEWDFIPCEAIIPGALWDDVNAILTKQSTATGQASKQPTHVFTGIVVCGDCGSKLVVPSTNPGKYVCPSKGCSRKIPADDLDAIFRDELSDFLEERSSQLDQIFSTAPATQRKRNELAKITVEIEKIEGDISKNHKLYTEGIITIERFGSVHRPLEAKLEELKPKAAILENELHELEASSDSENSESGSSQNLIQNWSKLTVKDQQRIVRILISKIIIGDGEIEITYNFSKAQPQASDNPTSQQSSTTTSPPSSLKDATTSQQTQSPTTRPPKITTDEPIYIRLPKAGEHCPRTGLSRSKLNQLILPTEHNGFRPQVKSKVIRKKGNQRGTRLILWESLKKYLEELD